MTGQIPAPLSAVAARMVTESDRLESERAELQDLYAVRLRRMTLAFWAAVASTITIGATGIVAMLR